MAMVWIFGAWLTATRLIILFFAGASWQAMTAVFIVDIVTLSLFAYIVTTERDAP